MALAARIHSHLAAGEPAVLVRVVEALGSTPREAGAAMLVSGLGIEGTIGGGALEQQAIATARAMMSDGRMQARLDVPLGPAIGQCCGGRVALSLDVVSPDVLADEETRAAEIAARKPAVFVFGAGHTGHALALALAPLPFRVTVVDARPSALVGLPPEVGILAAALPEAVVEAAEPGAAFLVMTHDHGLDFLIAAAALARGDAAYVGMIGSATKRETFRRHLAAQGMAPLMAKLTLPIGGTAVRDKRPEVIAALTAAELVVTLLENSAEKRGDGFAAAPSRCNSIQVRTTVNKAAEHASAS